MNVRQTKSLRAGSAIGLEVKVLRIWEIGGIRMCLAGDETGLTRIEIGSEIVEEGCSYRFSDAVVRQYPGGWTSLSMPQSGRVTLLARDIEIPQDPEYIARTYRILSGIQRKKARRDGRLPEWSHPAQGAGT
jgi:hypothetical protein